MPKQINVKLGFEADTSQAKKQIQDLQKSLDNLLTSSTKNSTFKEFKDDVLEAQQSVFKLQGVLNNSLNADTGRLDLSKFNAQLDAADMSIGTLAADMRKLGPDGERAFLNLANSIVTAQKPMMETNKLLDGMWTALKNTARWQLSSSILHGFMSSLQGAYGYAQDLNASLNSIRIVSGQSVEQMAAFADQANRSAQALSTSTLAYTDAALIFYQQGLSGDAVTERVDTVLKLSNVTGDSAEQVSNYMTAIWNNFYDGSESLESFADKITALGAATASSSAEISAGLQQFAAIGNTVGLSYDYAATALATIVAQTRQSESTVGNGLRTIFARLSSLKQGDTTEDGVDLTKYTAALEEVGVSVMDQNGQLKEMDQILEDIGAKWNTLSKNQQNALAQTVGGVRQYATLIALFDNWDQFQRNLDVTRNAEGTLEEQSEIYEQSWEAARKRVLTAWQSIYQDLIDDEFFIDTLDGITSILKGVDKLIDSIGGLKGVLATVSSLVMTVFNKQLVQGFEKAQQAMKNIKLPWQDSSLAERQSDAMVMILKNQLDDMYPKNSTEDVSGNTEDYILKGLKDQVDLNYQLKSMYDDLTDSQKEFANGLIKQTEELHNSVVEAAKLRDTFSANALESKRNINNDLTDFKNSGNAEAKAKAYSFKTYIENVGNTEQFQNLVNIKDTEEYEKALDHLTQTYAKHGNAVGVATKHIRDYIDAKAKAKKADLDLDETNKKYTASLEKTSERLDQLKNAHDKGTASSTYLREELDKVIASLEKEKAALENEIAKKEQAGEKTDDLKNRLAELNNEIQKAENLQDSFNFKGLQGLDPQVFITAARGVSELVSGLTAINRALEIFEDKDPDLTWMDKITKALPSLMMGLPMISKAMKDLTPAIGAVTTAASESFTAAGAGLGGLLAALKAGIAALWEFIGPALIVIGVFYGLKKAWEALEAASPEGKLKAAREELEKATEEANKAKQEYDDLKSTLESYNDLKENINDMDETDRAKSVAEMNSEMLDLITNTENWANIFKNGIQYDETTGLIKITEAQQELLKKEEAKAYYAAQRLETEKKIIELNAEEKKDDSDLSFQFKKFAGGNNVTSEVLDALANNNLQGLKDYDSLIQNVQEKDISEDEKNNQIEELKNLQQEQTESIKTALLGAGFSEEEIEGNLLPQIENVISNEDALKEMVAAILDHISNNNQEEAYKEASAREALGTSNEFNDLTEDSQKNAIERFQTLDSDKQEEIANALIDGEDLTKVFEAAGLAVEDLERNLHVVHEALAQIDEDVDEDELASLTNFLNTTDVTGLSDQLLVCEESAEAVAESILRFDDAIQDVEEHYDDWMYTLKNGTIQDQAEAMAQLKDAYSDMLDLNFGSLSEDFLSNAQNLEWMKQAAEGSEEAYNNLMAAAQNDIRAQVGLDTSEFDAKFAELDGRIQAGIKDIEVGAYVDDSQAIQAMNELINAAEMTAEQATDLLASMGVDAEVEQVEVPETQKQALIDAVPDITTESVEVPNVVQDGTGGTTVDSTTVQVPTINYEPVKATETEEGEKMTTMLRVKSARKSSGGNFKFSNSKHGGGTQGSNGPSGGGKKGGGGGGSKEKKKTVKEHKKPEKKEDRYHDIKERISDLNRELKRLQKTEDRVYGKAKLKYMDQEIEKLEKQIELTDEYIAEIKKYAAIDQANLRGIGMGAQFDENGRLTNYEEVLSNIVSSYNSSIAAYNSAADAFNASAQEDEDSAALEIAEKQVSAAKEVYDERLKILDQYEDTYNLYQEKMDERIDQVWELFDKRLEKITWRIEFELDWNEKELTQFDWLLKYIGKDADHAADAVANLSKQMGVYEESLEWAKQGIAGIFDLHGITFDFDNADPQQLYNQLADFMNAQNLESQLTEKEADALLDYMDAMRDAYDGMYDAWIDAHDHMMNAWDEWQERLQDGLNDIAQYGEELEGIQKIIDLTGRKMLKMTTQDINRMNQALVVNAQEYLRAATARRDALEPSVQAAEAHLQELIAGGASEEAIQLARDEYRQMMEDWQDATNDWYDAFADALQAGENAFNAFIENSTKDYKEGFGKMDLDYMTEQFDRQKKVRDLYLDDYQKYHELNKTAQELNKSLAATNNDLIREKLLDLQDDMNASMQDGVKISSAQAEIYARRVALLQAEAELLDAQNAKSAVRMTRDNEGNFSYTYTADQEQIGEAENNYGDKFYELLEFERNYADQIQEEMLQSFQDFIDRRNEIAELYKDDQDAYNQAMEELQEEYLAYMDYYVGELDMDFYEMGRLRDDDWLDFEDITGQKLAEHDDFIDHFTDTITGELTEDYNTAGELANQWRALMEKSCQDSTQAVSNYQINTETTYNKAGENIETYGQKVNQKFDEMANKSVNTADAVEDMANDMVNAMAAIQGETYELDNTWAYVMDDMRNQIANTISALQQLMQSLDLVVQKAQAAIAAAQAAAMAQQWAGLGNDVGGGSGSGPGGGSGNVRNPGKTANPGTQDTLSRNTTITSTYGPNKAVHEWEHEGNTIYADKIISVSSTGANGHNGMPSDILRMIGYDSGGYTGAWGSNGKLAMLHEKELVLNKEDTENILSVVDTVRDMISSFGGNVLNDIAKSITNSGSLAFASAGTMDQNVHIEANFPNVQSHSEIEMALNNLINSASQYVNKK